MSDIVLRVENLYKQYRLGVVGSGTLRDDVGRWFAKMRGKEDPTMQIGATNTLNEVEGEYVWALQDINFEVKQGEVLGIIGKNGAGKSTLLKILSKITTPTEGNIRIKGRVASLLEVGTGFHPELTGRENIFLNGAILGMTKAEIRKKLDEIIDFAGVAKYVDTPVKRYSSGMRVRLGFAVAAFLEPEILVVDEVLAVGDAEFQKKAIGKMQDVSQGEGRTVLFVSHNMGSVKSLCSNAIILEQGRLKQQGDVEEIVACYFGGGERSRNYIKFSENDGLPGFHLISVGAKGLDKGFNQPISRENAVEIIIEYDYNQKIADRLDFTLQFKGEDGTVLFTSSTGMHKLEKIRVGKNLIKMNIPSKFLNEGTFHINLLVVEDYKKIVLKEDDLISFMVTPETKKLGGWMGKTKGFLRPKFEWVS